MVILKIAHDISWDILGKCNTTTEANVQNCEKKKQTLLPNFKSPAAQIKI